jgi:hypothetical protein
VNSGVYVHTNNCLDAELVNLEDDEGQVESEGRRLRLETSLRASRGALDLSLCMAFLADESGEPVPICRRGRPGSSIATVAALIAEPARRALHITCGPPSLSPFHEYTI